MSQENELQSFVFEEAVASPSFKEARSLQMGSFGEGGALSGL
jgi:hypothetical protein